MQHRLCQCSDAQVQVIAGGGGRACWLPRGLTTWRDPGGAGEGTGADEQRRLRGHAHTASPRRTGGRVSTALHSKVEPYKPSIITSSGSTLPSPLQHPVRVAPGSWELAGCARVGCRVVTVDEGRSIKIVRMWSGLVQLHCVWCVLRLSVDRCCRARCSVDASPSVDHWFMRSTWCGRAM